MLPVFMKIATCCNFLFYARCGAKDFFDKLGQPLLGAAFLHAENRGKAHKNATGSPEWAAGSGGKNCETQNGVNMGTTGISL